mmetsp:Transcript_981/g.1760  ORF Transcript_981/g.1760 Transcript_981/m.1760 type:complete len:197 (+) Transcript_981:309-899(+)
MKMDPPQLQDLFEIPAASLQDITTKKFYRYFLTQNMPLRIEDACADWPALQKWTDDYLQAQLSNSNLRGFTIPSEELDLDYAAQFPGLPYQKFKFDIKDAQQDRFGMTMAHFLAHRNKDRTKLVTQTVTDSNGEDQVIVKQVQQLLYIDDQSKAIMQSSALLADIVLPAYLSSYLQLKDIRMTYWQDFRRKPQFNK